MDINREEILKTAARYVVLSLGFWRWYHGSPA